MTDQPVLMIGAGALLLLALTLGVLTLRSNLHAKRGRRERAWPWWAWAVALTLLAGALSLAFFPSMRGWFMRQVSWDLASWKWHLLGIGVGVVGGALLCEAVLRQGRLSLVARCRECRYPLPEARAMEACPECGWTASHATEVFRPRRPMLLLALGALLLACAPLVMWAPTVRALALRQITPVWRVSTSSAYGAFTVDRMEVDPVHLGHTSPGGTRLVVRDAGGRAIATIEDWRLEIGEELLDSSGIQVANRRIGEGDDITGNGRANLLVTGYSGGAHCCWTYHLFELDADGHGSQIATIDAPGSAAFRDHDLDGVPELDRADDSWDYWHAPHVSSARPAVIRRWSETERRYVVAPDLMLDMERFAPDYMLGPSPDDALAAPWPTDGDDVPKAEPDPMVWSAMLNLMYRGRENEAWTLLADAWEGTPEEREAFVAAFREQLDASAWPEVREALKSLPQVRLTEVGTLSVAPE